MEKTRRGKFTVGGMRESRQKDGDPRRTKVGKRPKKNGNREWFYKNTGKWQRRNEQVKEFLLKLNRKVQDNE